MGSAPNPNATKNVTTAASQPTYVEEPQNYIFTYSLNANQGPILKIPVNIDRDSDFLLTGVYGSSTGTYNTNFYTPSGRQMFSSSIPNTLVLGTPNQPTPIGPPPIYRAGSIGPAVDLQDTSGATNNIVIVFAGIRRIKTA